MKLHPYLRKAQFYETDGMGIIYHGNYIHWMEEARTNFMEQIGWGYERATEAGIDFALTDISCSYRKTTKFGETLAISLKITKLSPARLVLTYRMVNPETGELHAEGTSSHFFYDRNSQKPVALKKVFPELYQLLQSCVEQESNTRI